MRKKHPEHVNLERWLVSYADFITLLFAFFVIMYAISQADVAKFKTVSQSIRQAFSSAGAIDLQGSSGGPTVSPFEQIEPPGGRAINLPAGKTNTAASNDPELQEMKELLEETISLEVGTSDTSDKMVMQFDSSGLTVRLAANDFFADGSIVVRDELLPLLDRIGRVLAKSRRIVRVEGHTDAMEEARSRYSNGWELSAARASWVVQYWMKRFQVDPKRFAAVGYSHFRPLTEKQDEWSRGKNRRIEIIIPIKRYPLPF